MDGRSDISRHLRRMMSRFRPRGTTSASHSRNSAQAPLRDGYQKPPPKSQREPSGNKVGGQPGPPGHTLMPGETPRYHSVHAVSTCARCSVSHTDQPAKAVDYRQVFDWPPQHLHVTELQAESKECPICHQRVTAALTEQQTEYLGPLLRWVGWGRIVGFLISKQLGQISSPVGQTL